MAIKIASNLLPGINGFLDARQGIADKIEDLKYWPFDKYPIPAGFEVFVQGDWYTYHPELENDETGSFIKRKGGLSKVLDLEKLQELIGEVGDLVYVASEEEYYQFTSNNEWEKLKLGGATGGIPIYTKKILNSLDREDIPEEYLMIPSESDLEGGLEEGETTITVPNGSSNYLDIIFKTLRTLQTEVAKMRNAFKMGMCSYTGSHTALSSALQDMEDPEEEPLWAIEPDGLSLITGASIEPTDEHTLYPPENVDVTENTLTIKDSASWTDSDLLIKSNEDSKLFYYITTSSLSYDIELFDLDETTSLVQRGSIPMEIVGKNLGLTKYETLVIISRQTKEKNENEEEEIGGKNYIYISITNPRTNQTVREGYWNPGTNLLSSSIVEIDYRAWSHKLIFRNLSVFRTDVYSKYQRFTQEVIPSKPDDEDYKYKVAHITIRSVSNYEELTSIKDELLENELIYEESFKKLYIKSNNNIVTIGSQTMNPGGEDNDNNNGMDELQIIELLKSMGIVQEEGSGNLKLSSISDITFIHQGTGKSFKVEVDADGELRSSELAGETLKKRLTVLDGDSAYKINKDKNLFRGFVSRLHCGENKVNAASTSDVKINADRIKIGAVYCPFETNTSYGCSHAFVELENTSKYDFPLEGCYLHYAYFDSTVGKVLTEHLPLTGILKAGSTYLIRGKKYSDPEDNPKTYINVDDYDQEWYVKGELIDFSKDNTGTTARGFALTYGNNNEAEGIPEITPDVILQADKTDSTFPSDVKYEYPWYVIDFLPLYAHFKNTKPWGINFISSPTNGAISSDPSYEEKSLSNSIIRNMFELDPAKQALQSLSIKDSSRVRLQNNVNDVMCLDLDKEYIEFPGSDIKRHISYYTPKSSKHKKNISTDKTKLDFNRPNAVNCSFGINSYTTRCFNWVSAGEYDEFVWIKVDDSWKKFESYKEISEELQTIDGEYPRRKEFSVDINNTVYNRIVGHFPINNIPGNGPLYTSHKCIIEIVETSVEEKTTYTYIVGRADKTGHNPDLDHCCEEHTFTLYPEEGYSPKIYLTSDQQGFHWVEYQVWSAAANAINSKIISDCSENDIIPVLLNSGDMTQNGTRINEWLDYFLGAEKLLKHLEHAAVVGNNDLCGPDPGVLGTGDDPGKSSSYYFHVFFCYEISQLEYTDPTTQKKYSSVPIITGINNGEKHYIPSLYYFDFKTRRIFMCNSEITSTTCKSSYDLGFITTDKNENYVINAYSGFGCPQNSTETNSKVEYEAGKRDITTVYTMMWIILNDAKESGKKTIVCCHEMPFTVITLACINIEAGQHTYSRSVSDKNALVGCHMNQINPQDKKGLYWFSRLLEFFRIKLVLGGHKHTYTCTHPVREYYYYTDGENRRNSLEHGPMDMPITLENDSADFNGELVIQPNGNSVPVNLSKFPIIERDLAVYCKKTESDGKTTYVTENVKAGSFYPCTAETQGDAFQDHRVVYFMTQATGYKQTSNKELPTNYQGFSYLIPATIPKATKDEADNSQKYPMYVEVNISDDTNWYLDLIRIANIQNENFIFNQSFHGTGETVFEYALGIPKLKDKIYIGDTTNTLPYETYGTKYCTWGEQGNDLTSSTVKISISKATE